MAGIGAGAQSAEQTPPNLLVILSDDQVFRAWGGSGNEHVKTPVLDALADTGTVFTDCYVNNPICTPSRAALLTGQYGFTNGVTFFGHGVRPEAPRLPRLLAEAGYTTAYTGKWHNDGRPVDHGFERMRHVFLGGMHDYHQIPVVQGREDAREMVVKNPTELFTDAAVELLEDLPEPWCLFVCYTAPHDPRTPPPDYAAMYSVDDLPLPRNFRELPDEHHWVTLGIRDEKLLPRPLVPAAVRHEIAQYYGLISHMDAQIARILQAVEQQGQRERTVISFAGDNGLALGAHGLLGKQTLYEEGIRVPLILNGPGVPARASVSTPVNMMDLMPTLCETGGAAVPGAVQAQSLWPHLREKTGEEKPVYAHYEDYFRMVRRGRYKLIHSLKSDHLELFDLERDPFELENLAGVPELLEQREQLQGLLRTWRTGMRDTV